MQLTPDRWRISVNDNGTLNHAYIGFARLVWHQYREQQRHQRKAVHDGLFWPVSATTDRTHERRAKRAI
jgi:hypothetical protein